MGARSPGPERPFLFVYNTRAVHVNTLMIQCVLAEPPWMERMEAEDFRALTPLLYRHVNPYGAFQLDMDSRLPIDPAEQQHP